MSRSYPVSWVAYRLHQVEVGLKLKGIDGMAPPGVELASYSLHQVEVGLFYTVFPVDSIALLFNALSTT